MTTHLDNSDLVQRNRLRQAIVKASTDNKTEEPTHQQIFEALVALYGADNDDKFWEMMVVHATIELGRYSL